MTITTRAVKGSALTYDEMDANFNELESFANLLFGAAGQIVLDWTVPGQVTLSLATLAAEVSATVAAGSAVSLTTGVAANVASISLPAGVWDVHGQVDYTAGGTTTVVYTGQGSSATSATLGPQDSFSTTLHHSATCPVDPGSPIPTIRYILGAPTTIYLVSRCNFSVSTLKAYGTITAKQVNR